jgi:hypothetical protein
MRCTSYGGFRFSRLWPAQHGKRRVLALLDRLAGKPAHAAECVAFDTAKTHQSDFSRSGPELIEEVDKVPGFEILAHRAQLGPFFLQH